MSKRPGVDWNSRGNIKNTKYILIFFLGIIFLKTISARNNELTSSYNIKVFGLNIGEFSVTQLSKEGNIQIDVITEVKVNFLFSYRIKYIQRTVYSQGILKHSLIETYKNGNLNSTKRLRFENNSYLLITDGDTIVIEGPITYSGSLIYFNEPKGINQIYKERTARIRRLIPVAENIYTVKDEKERELNRYVYKDGILEYAKMRHAVGMLELKRVVNNTIND